MKRIPISPAFDRYLHRPNSTWTTARNMLLVVAALSQNQYEYFIFFDGDAYLDRTRARASKD
jgi:hypothetical protein